MNTVYSVPVDWCEFAHTNFCHPMFGLIVFQLRTLWHSTLFLFASVSRGLLCCYYCWFTSLSLLLFVRMGYADNLPLFVRSHVIMTFGWKLIVINWKTETVRATQILVLTSPVTILSLHPSASFFYIVHDKVRNTIWAVTTKRFRQTWFVARDN